MQRLCFFLSLRLKLRLGLRPRLRNYSNLYTCLCAVRVCLVVLVVRCAVGVGVGLFVVAPPTPTSSSVAPAGFFYTEQIGVYNTPISLGAGPLAFLRAGPRPISPKNMAPKGPQFLLKKPLPLLPPKKVSARYPHTLRSRKNARVVAFGSPPLPFPSSERGGPLRALGVVLALGQTRGTLRPARPQATPPALCLSSCSSAEGAEQVRPIIGREPMTTRPILGASAPATAGLADEKVSASCGQKCSGLRPHSLATNPLPNFCHIMYVTL